MAVQAIIDPEPMQLVANLAPAPADVVWKNTYLPRSNRMIRAWSITLLILLLTVFWSVLLLPLAALLDIETIRRVLPGFAGFLDKHITVASLVRTGLPTLLLSLLNVLVPYLYDCKSRPLSHQPSHCSVRIVLTRVVRAFKSSRHDVSRRC